MRNLTLLSPLDTLPHSNPGQQADGWSCGLWALKHLEEFLRRRRREIAQAEFSLEMVRTRVNLHISKLRPGVPVPKSTAQPKKDQANQRKEYDTFDEALLAAQECTKCRATRHGYKGCTWCMGKWFEHLRTRRTRGPHQPAGQPVGQPAGHPASCLRSFLK